MVPPEGDSTMEPPSTVIPHLPNEVMIKILSYVALSHDLASAALASRNLNALVQDFLYRSISLNISAFEEDNPAHKLGLVAERLSRLVNRLSANSELGLQTLALSLNVRIRSYYICEEYNTLLEHLPNLQHVSLSPPPIMCSIPDSFRPSSITLDFQHLRDNEPHRTMAVQYVFCSLLQLPEVRRMIFENLDFPSDNEPDGLFDGIRLRFSLLSGQRVLQDLHFIDCHDQSSGVNFEDIIRNIPALKSFVFVTNDSAVFEGLQGGPSDSLNNDIHDRYSSLGGIARALIPHMLHVEEIVLSPYDGTYGGYLKREWYFNHCFTNLRRVALPKCLLIQDIRRRSQCLLPGTLEEVQIQFTLIGEDSRGPEPNQSARENNIAALEWLLTAKSENLTQLKRVIWWYQGLKDPGWDSCYGLLPELQRLHKQFADVGVHFEWTLVALFRDTPFGRRLSD